MKENIVFLCLIILFWEYVCADPRVKSHSKSQILRRNKKAHLTRVAPLREKDYAQPLASGEVSETLTSRPPTVVDDEPTEDEDTPAKSSAEDEVVKFIGDDSKYIERDERKRNTGDDKSERLQRPLVAGDTFTAGELLPVTEKLFEKVDNPGMGKGIVSSSKSPQDLADKIFQAFFVTTKRIVTLTELDISGLDALQGLALVGDPATSEKFNRRAGQTKIVDINGQLVTSRAGEKTSRYNILHKVSRRRNGKAGKRKASSKLIKKLGKNRHLVVSKRNNMKKNTVSRKSSCRWSYECENPTDLDTCRLKAKCAPRRANEKVDHDEYINSNVDVDPKIVAQFRKSLSISALDEEVEKIIERKLLKLRPNDDMSQEIEGLSEYFRKILLAESKVAGEKDETTPTSIPVTNFATNRYKLKNVKKLDAKSSDMEAA